MSEKILFVDDEPGVLEGYRRLLHKEFSVDIAVSPGRVRWLSSPHNQDATP